MCSSRHVTRTSVIESFSFLIGTQLMDVSISHLLKQIITHGLILFEHKAYISFNFCYPLMI